MLQFTTLLSACLVLVMPLGESYSSVTTGFLDPTAFIKLHQTAP